ncbi:TAF5-like RNA polymerase II p300/CBP-associated factor-associated factor 65 kDa subunit 5L [Styela clava]
MKRARTEQMQALVLSYLKKRNFTDSEASYKLEFKFEETLRDMTTRNSEENDLSTSNTAALTVYSIDEYFQSFDEFLNHVKEAKRQKNNEITNIVYPIFCHLYLDLVSAGRKADAGNFYKNFKQRMVKMCKSLSPTLNKLAQIIQPTDIENNDEILEYRKKKFVVDMSYKNHGSLLRFLHSESSLLLLKVINLHIVINITEGTTLFDLFSRNEKVSRRQENSKAVKRKRMSIEQSKKPINGGTEVVTSSKQETITLSAPSIMSPPTPVAAPVDPAQPFIPEVDLKTLRSSIQAVNDSKPSIGNICVHRLRATESYGLTHATISNGYNFMSTGHEDSAVRLWKLASSSNSTDAFTQSNSAFNDTTSKTTQNTNTVNSPQGRLSPDVSKIHLGCDFFDTVKTKLEGINTFDNTNSMKCLRAHSDSVMGSCFSHDDKYLLTCSEDTTVRLWDLSTQKNKAIYRGHIHPVWCIAMSNYSVYFATGSFDKTARLWTTERTYPLRTFAGHHGDIESIAFHDNISYIATADKTIRLWDLASGKTVRLLLGHWASVSCLAFSPNGKLLASSGEDGRIRMWDIASGALIKEMRGHEGSVYSLDFSPDGSLLASGGSDSCLRVWNTRTAQTPSTRNNTDTNDPNLNTDFIGKWQMSARAIHNVKFQSTNLLHCILADR